MSEIKAKMALKEWMVKQKAFNDSVQYERRKSLQKETSSADLEEHSGVFYPQLRTMTEVESLPLLVDHTLLLCIAKEANLSGCQVAVNRGDNKQVQVIGCNGSSFCVRAVFSLSIGWNVTKAKTREITPSQESQDDDVEVNGNKDDIHGIKEGEAY